MKERKTEMKKLTRKELIAACVDNQIERGIVKPENRGLQIRLRLNGGAGIKAMRLSDCQSWYDSVFNS